MKLIYTTHFPPGNFHALNLFGILFVQRRWGRMALYELRHEHIHTLQQREMLYLFFYLWYAIEFLIRLFQHRFQAERAYFAISLEREAYLHQHDPHYRRHRRHYAWLHHLRSS